MKSTHVESTATTKHFKKVQSEDGCIEMQLKFTIQSVGKSNYYKRKIRKITIKKITIYEKLLYKKYDPITFH